MTCTDDRISMIFLYWFRMWQRNKNERNERERNKKKIVYSKIIAHKGKMFLTVCCSVRSFADLFAYILRVCLTIRFGFFFFSFNKWYNIDKYETKSVDKRRCIDRCIYRLKLAEAGVYTRSTVMTIFYAIHITAFFFSFFF